MNPKFGSELRRTTVRVRLGSFDIAISSRPRKRVGPGVDVVVPDDAGRHFGIREDGVTSCGHLTGLKGGGPDDSKVVLSMT